MSARDDYPPSALLSGSAPLYEEVWTKLDNLTNALKWIRQAASLHYMGGAFDPEHMRELASMATDALNGEPVDDYEEAMRKAEAKAAEWRVLFSEAGDPEDVQRMWGGTHAGAHPRIDQDQTG